MKLSIAGILLFGLALAQSGCSGGDDGSQEKSASDQPPLPPDLADMTPNLVLETSMGRIVLELDRDRAPKSVENVIAHVQNDFYNGLTFHRVRPGFMIQAGGFTADLAERQSPRPPVPNEAKNGLKNARGTVAMARLPDPHSAKAQFFINLVDNSFLDFTAETSRGWGYAVIGRVVEGMDVVDAIAEVPTEQRGMHEAVPRQPIVIERAYIAE